jgi:MoxR-like ATPase
MEDDLVGEKLDTGRIRESLGQIIRGKDDAIELLLTGVLAGGHVLLEDVPGVGKTTLGKALARCFAAEFARVQFTPDLLPADIIGSQVLEPATSRVSFRPGPIFANVLLADEINRASPRTQSALLEAMNEGQVTVEGATHRLPEPFCVIATQNPLGFQGTYPLPEAQLDRFALCFALGHPEPEIELEVLLDRRQRDPLDALEPLARPGDWAAACADVATISVERDVARYMLHIVERTRCRPEIELGVSTRGALAWFRCAQARAYLAGRSWVGPEDFQILAAPVLAHRIQLGAEARYGGKTTAGLLAEMIAEVELPI